MKPQIMRASVLHFQLPMKHFHFPPAHIGLITLAAALVASNASAAPQANGNLGRGLRELLDYNAQSKLDLQDAASRAKFAQGFKRVRGLQLDAAGRVLVDVHLDGRRSLADVRVAAQALGVRISSEVPGYRKGGFSAWVPLRSAPALAKTVGVRSVLLALPPVFMAGKAESQGVALIHSDQANATGYDGTGITVAAMSDSYDGYSAFPPLTMSGQDVKTGDLPGPKNPEGNLLPVMDVAEPTGGEEENEGRAMLQIVHDVAPGARLCFGTAYASEFDFSRMMVSLTDTSTGVCGANVLVDDTMYFTEPMFEDGLLAQTIDQLAGQGIAYFSAAGNEPPINGYAATFAPIDDATARSTTTSVDLSQIPSQYSVGGFHNFAAASGGMDVAQTVTVLSNGGGLSLQWNDPFDSPDVKTDYDIFLFSGDGKTLLSLSTDDNAQTGEPVEFLPLGAGTYKLVISRADTNPGAPSAPELRWVVLGELLAVQYPSPSPTLFGHPAAAGDIATAAVPFFASYLSEGYTSNGPVSIEFDTTGQRLNQPLVRQKPDIAAPDGVDTTFFPATLNAKGRVVAIQSIEDTDKFPNFFGTSAAAPHAAAVSALLMQKAGGPGKLSPASVRSILQQSAQLHDLQPAHSTADVSSGKVALHVDAVGQGLLGANQNPDAFTVTLTGPAGTSLQSLSFDLSKANSSRVYLGSSAPGLSFDPDPTTNGYPFTLGALKGLTAQDVSVSPLSAVPPYGSVLSLAFAPGKFTSGASLSFGVGRQELAYGAVASSADQLAGGVVSGVIVDAKGTQHTFTTTFTNGAPGHGWTPVDGFGLVDAMQALSLVQTPGR